MKNITYLLLLLVFAFFVSCDSNDDGSTGPENNQLIGTWIVQELRITVDGESLTYSAEFLDIDQTLNVYSDGSFLVETINGGITYSDWGRWSDEGNTIELTISGETYNIPFVVSESSLQLTMPMSLINPGSNTPNATVVMTYNHGEDDGSTDPVNDPIVGTWELEELRITVDGETTALTPEMLGMEQTITINLDGTIQTVTTLEGETETDNGTWTVSDNTMVLTQEGETIDIPYVLTESSPQITIPMSFIDPESENLDATVVMIYSRE